MLSEKQLVRTRSSFERRLVLVCTGVMLFAHESRVRGVDTCPPPPGFLSTGTIGGLSPSREPRLHNGLSGALGGSHHERAVDKDCTYWLRYDRHDGEKLQREAVQVYVEQVSDTRGLLHDLEEPLRKRVDMGLPEPFELKNVDSHHLFFVNSGQYIWLSGINHTVMIRWIRQDRQPDGSVIIRELPDDFLATFLNLLPSSIPDMTLDDAHSAQFIREEFDYEFEGLTADIVAWGQRGGKRDDPAASSVSVGVKRIRDLRARYFGGETSATRELKEIQATAERLKDLPRREAEAKALGIVAQGLSYGALKEQYDELKQWWAAHRNDRFDVHRPPLPPEGSWHPAGP